eukprot:CAMPEP_0115533580 /NCGR_PEP_ID=MMETSP0271-20121206/86204_1 /TAXON_ID=71861 /ORGANISM="Scrippsiella trochoidea, Strain CCMP3099" /LENGTH=344 /DNA_ID=CAMNT_0002965985 /DNA_START=162 /DNA_END=1192 /DNA_ORIENTATION=+
MLTASCAGQLAVAAKRNFAKGAACEQAAVELTLATAQPPNTFEDEVGESAQPADTGVRPEPASQDDQTEVKTGLDNIDRLDAVARLEAEIAAELDGKTEVLLDAKFEQDSPSSVEADAEAAAEDSNTDEEENQSRPKQNVTGQCVPVDSSPFLPIPPDVLKERLGQQLASLTSTGGGHHATAQNSISQLEAWGNVCEQLELLVRAELSELYDSLSASYRPFDPARKYWVGQWPLPDEEAKFAQEFLRAAALAGFTPVSRKDLERTRVLKADLLSLPVTILWDRLDSRWIEHLYRQSAESLPEAQPVDPGLSDFGGYIFVLKRGVSVQQVQGRLLMPKLDSLQSQ